jgi:epoxyqueuosine reductase
MNDLYKYIKQQALLLGFNDFSVTCTDTSSINQRYMSIIGKDYHAEMDYLNNNHELRNNPDLLVENAKSIIMVRMDYLPPNANIIETLRDKNKAYIARYALGRDYHRLIRKRLKQLAKKIEEKIGPFSWRPFADSAPVYEKPLAAKAGLGWQGKNTLVINKKAGSYFFLGALYTSLDLPTDKPVKDHCGSCAACIDICPTQAIRAPYQLDSRRCISYWTIEHKGSIPVEIREKMGNRVFGCDDCQLICPWNKFAKTATEQAFLPRHKLDSSTLLELFNWDEQTYLKNTEGSAIRRTGYNGWLRNLAIGLGNTPHNQAHIEALKYKYNSTQDNCVKEHIFWALKQQDN